MSLSAARFIQSFTNPSEIPESQAEVAFCGRSNVGKSSLLNAMCGKKTIARVSQTPGRTRLINIFETEPERWLVDLPGYGFAVGPKAEIRGWQAMIEGYLLNRPMLRCLLLLIDAKVGPTAKDKQMVDWIRHNNLPYRIVANKADQVRSSHALKRRKEIAQQVHQTSADVFWVSSRTGKGVLELRGSVRQYLDKPIPTETEEAETQ